jgi:hypothetical protein
MAGGENRLQLWGLAWSRWTALVAPGSLRIGLGDDQRRQVLPSWHKTAYTWGLSGTHRRETTPAYEIDSRHFCSGKHVRWPWVSDVCAFLLSLSVRPVDADCSRTVQQRA